MRRVRNNYHQGNTEYQQAETSYVKAKKDAQDFYDQMSEFQLELIATAKGLGLAAFKTRQQKVDALRHHDREIKHQFELPEYSNDEMGRMSLDDFKNLYQERGLPTGGLRTRDQYIENYRDLSSLTRENLGSQRQGNPNRHYYGGRYYHRGYYPYYNPFLYAAPFITAAALAPLAAYPYYY